MIVTLLTDYGHDDEFAGVCHAVIRAIHPEAEIVDLTHGIPRHSVREPLPDDRRQAIAAADYVTFTSSSTVRSLMSALGDGGLSGGVRVVSIGPVTTDTLREAGLEPHLEAARHDIDGVVEALLADAAARSR